LSEQCNDFICKCARAGDETNRAGLKYLVRNDTDLALSGCTHAGTVGTYQPRSMLSHNKHRTRHIDDGNTLSDTNDQFDTCTSSFHNGIRSACWWNEDATRVRVGSGFCLRDGIENRYAFDGSASLARSDTADNGSSRGFHIACMKLALAPSNTLYDDPCCVI